MRPRITFIGGGSYLWMPTLLRDCCLTPELAGHHVMLHDISPAPLAVMERLMRKMIREFSADLTVGSTLDRRRALDGARFVVIGIAVGGLAAMKHDLAVPWKYGVRHPVGDSAGPGGISRALRNVPVFAEIGSDVGKRCPGAWVLNLSNPMSVLTRALTLTPGSKTAGICHGLREGAEFIRELCGIDSLDRVRLDAAGINHFSFAVRLTIDGRDGWPVFRKAMGRRGSRGLVPFRLGSEIFLRHGAFPLFPDRHTAEFLDCEIGPGSGYGRRYGLRLTTIADRRRNLGLRKAKVRKWFKEPVPRERSDEEVTRIMAAIVTGRPFEAVVNLPNRGQFVDAPRDAVVESFGIADQLGLRPYVTPSLPPHVRDLVLAHIESQELTARAALSGDRRLAREAFALDPVSRRISLLGEMVDRLINANREFLPRFFVRRSR
jgi:alpha-galactosidase